MPRGYNTKFFKNLSNGILLKKKLHHNFIGLPFNAENIFFIFSSFLITFSFSIEIFYRTIISFKEASLLNQYGH